MGGEKHPVGCPTLTNRTIPAYSISSYKISCCPAFCSWLFCALSSKNVRFFVQFFVLDFYTNVCVKRDKLGRISLMNILTNNRITCNMRSLI
jgi:hypothetical protein